MIHISCLSAAVPVNVLSHSVMFDSLRPHGLQPGRHFCPCGFSRQEHWSRLPCPPSGDLPNLGIEPRSPTLQADSLLSEPPRRIPNNLCPSKQLILAIPLSRVYKFDRFTDIENRLVVAKGQRCGGGMEWEFWISRYKLFCIGLNSKVLLCSTGSYMQYL